MLVSDPAVLAPGTADAGQIAVGPKRRILVVDDSRDSALSMAMMLKLMGNEVRAAHTGIEAVEQAQLFRPQVILMDVGMPQLNGYEATRLIRGEAVGQDRDHHRTDGLGSGER